MLDGWEFSPLQLEAEEQSNTLSLLQEIASDEFSKSLKTSGQLGDDLNLTFLDGKSLMNGNVDFSNAWQNSFAKYLRTNYHKR